MERFWGFVKGVFYIVLGAMLAFFTEQYFFSKGQEINKLDYNVSFKKEILSKPNFPKSNIEIKVDGKDKSALSLLEIDVLNYTTEVYKDIVFHITIKPRNNDRLNILSSHAVGEGNLPNLVAEAAVPKKTGEAYRASYVVTAFNRSEKYDYGLKVYLLVEGEEPEVSVVAEGVKTRKFEIEHSPFIKDRDRKAIMITVGWLIVVVIFMVVVLMPLVAFVTRPLDRKIEKRYAKEMYDSFRAIDHLSGFSEADSKEIVASLLFSQRMINWNRRNIISRLVFGIREPKKEDFEIE